MILQQKTTALLELKLKRSYNFAQSLICELDYHLKSLKKEARQEAREMKYMRTKCYNTESY